jgi:N6-adenosine-specific RNA methylase IME4
VRYRTIVADPPWDYGRDHERWATSPSGRQVMHKEMPYTPMSVAEIASLPVARSAKSDARLFLWATNRYLQGAFGVLEAWGFKYRQVLVWHKTGNPSPFGGSVAPVHAEFLLVAERGTPPVLQRWSGSVIAANKPVAEHSRKPDVFLDLAETVSPGPYLELFARRQRLGWDTWGDEALNHVDLGAA